MASVGYYLQIFKDLSLLYFYYNDNLYNWKYMFLYMFNLYAFVNHSSDFYETTKRFAYIHEASKEKRFLSAVGTCS